MRSSSPAWAVDLAVVPSRLARGISLFLHLLALVAVTATGGLPLSLRLVVAAGVVLAAALAWRAEGARVLRLREVGEEWWLERGARRGMMRLRNAHAWRWLVVLELAGEWQGRRWRERVVVWPDAVPPDAFRRLRVRLLCGPRRSLPPRPRRAPAAGQVPAPADGGRGRSAHRLAE